MKLAEEGGAAAPDPTAPRRKGWFCALDLAICLALSVCAFAARSDKTLLWLTAANLLLLWSGGKVLPLRGELRVFLWQTLVISGLYVLRFGYPEGLWAGMKMSWQLFLAFLPLAMFMRRTPSSRVSWIFSRIMPYRVAFVLTVSLGLLPVLLEEIRHLHEVQILRGARIHPRDMIDPRNWPDAIHGLAVPAVIRSMVIAGEIATAARARGFGIRPRRTCWPGD